MSGFFNYENEKVADISEQVGLTPEAWNGNIFATVIAFVMTLDLIQMLVDRNNLHDVDTWIFFKRIFKIAYAILS